MKPIRSILFVPGDSEKKIAKAGSIAADALVYDLEDSVLPERRSTARVLVAQALTDKTDNKPIRAVRINPLDTSDALEDLSAVIHTAPDIIMLPKIYSVDDINVLGNYLDALEVREGLPRGSTAILPIVTETPQIMFAHGTLEWANGRMMGATWGAEDLSTALGASTNKADNGDWGFTYQMARSQCLLAARSIDVQAIDTLFADFSDAEGLHAACRQSRRDGFSGKLAIHPGQVDIINAAFTPSDEEVAFARRVIASFAAQPEAGTVQLDGKMLDIPHLKQARNIVEQYEIFCE